MVVVGDVMPGRRSPATWGAGPPLGAARGRADDVLVANLECPLTDASPRGRGLAADPAAATLFRAGDVACLANNHILDAGAAGLAQTRAVLQDRGVLVTGAGADRPTALHPARLTVDDVEVAVLACADARFASDLPGQVVIGCGDDDLYAAVANLSRAGVKVVVAVHKGVEHTPVYSPGMHQVAGRAAEAGADLVVFHHAHRLGGVVDVGGARVITGAGNHLFAATRSRGVHGWHQTAAFRVTWTERAPVLDPVPLTLDDHGMPGPAAGVERTRARVRVAVLSRLLAHRWGRAVVAVACLADPRYLRRVTADHVRLLRRSGVVVTLRSIGAAIGAIRGTPR